MSETTDKTLAPRLDEAQQRDMAEEMIGTHGLWSYDGDDFAEELGELAWSNLTDDERDAFMFATGGTDYYLQEEDVQAIGELMRGAVVTLPPWKEPTVQPVRKQLWHDKRKGSTTLARLVGVYGMSGLELDYLMPVLKTARETGVYQFDLETPGIYEWHASGQVGYFRFDEDGRTRAFEDRFAAIEAMPATD